ncbi:mechanosensitive ion channel family protein [Haloterrigena alkaliphila]|uniref:Mechanosensitive ion channel family protein n=1 Tax=Haloterrigena alkaliphila TaxID=2816475 RepID=A0A8A2VLK7_9EURY|nr:mechanosensitive ion channel family protein [Haloterrigena alkaliphila]QSW99058.1 mechanosensitive ion channel family protein [Haloterrigena alkaliphila]
MNRRLGYAFLVGAVGLSAAAGAIRRFDFEPIPGDVVGVPATGLLTQALLVAAVGLAVSGSYVVVLDVLLTRTVDKRWKHDLRNLVRLVFVVLGIVGVLGVLTQQYVGVVFSLGIVGFAITFALQQPLFSLIGWIYIMVNRPYSVGDRVAIEGSKGDVVEVDFFVTTLWEINGELVSSHQPSGRVITLPNSVVLSSHVHNYSFREFPHVWNELSIQVAYETDLEFARALMIEEASDYLGADMRRAIEQYRERLAETPVELEVRDRPSVNVVQEESWIDLRLRYLVHPRQGQRVRNELYERILERMNDNPDRVAFPVSRSR